MTNAETKILRLGAVALGLLVAVLAVLLFAGVGGPVWAGVLAGIVVALAAALLTCVAARAGREVSGGPAGPLRPAMTGLFLRLVVAAGLGLWFNSLAGVSAGAFFGGFVITLLLVIPVELRLWSGRPESVASPYLRGEDAS